MRFRDVGGRIVEGSAWFVGDLLVLGANLADGIVPTVVPRDVSFAIYPGPGAVFFSESFLGVSVGLESDEEVRAVALPNFPFTEVVIAAGHIRGDAGFSELDAIDGGDFLFVAVFVDDLRGSVHVDAGDLRRREALAVTVFVDDDDRAVIVCGVGRCHSNRREQKDGGNSDRGNETTHDSPPQRVLETGRRCLVVRNSR